MQLNYDELPPEVKCRVLGFVNITGLTALVDSDSPEGLVERKIKAQPAWHGHYGFIKDILVGAVTGEGQIWISSGLREYLDIVQRHRILEVLDHLCPYGFVGELFERELDFIVRERGKSYYLNLSNVIERIPVPCLGNGGGICKAA